MTKKEIYIAELYYQFRLFLTQKKLSIVSFSELYGISPEVIKIFFNGFCIDDANINQIARVLDIIRSSYYG